MRRRLVVLRLVAACSSGTSTSEPTARPTPTPVTTTSAPAVTASDWTTYGGDAQRSSYVGDGPDPAGAAVTWRAALDGRVYGSPLVIGGRVIAATEGGSLYSLDLRTGRVMWRKHVAEPLPLSALPCGNIDPVSFTGTPVYDPATKLVFAVAMERRVRHVLYGLRPGDGAVALRRVVDVPGMDPATHQQRAALLLAGSVVYIAYGGNYGDCGQYRGRVIGAATAGNGPLRSYAVPTQREGGIWGASGPALLPGGDLLVTTGNGAATGGAWDKTDSVLRLSPALSLKDAFAPTDWAQENSADADLGSMGPVLLPGNRRVVTAGKGGNVFLLDVDHLGGVGGQLSVLDDCHAYGGGAATPHAVLLPCEQGVTQVTASGDRLQRGWTADVVGSPLVVGTTVWVVDQEGRATGLDARTGKQRAQLDVGAATRFAKPAYSDGFLLLPTKAGVTAVRLTRS
ncbi:MAG: PQQ-binding-like beta-propeller repeat protein [Mycobacteriales bacterium]